MISGKFGNQAARKVDHKTEKLIIGISCLPNKPFNSNVAEMYNQFVCGELEVYDPETGELFDPEEFVDKNGNPKELSESTISNYLNRPKNRLLIAKAARELHHVYAQSRCLTCTVMLAHSVCRKLRWMT